MKNFGYCQDLQKISHQPREILLKSQLTSWKCLSERQFFECSLACIFENIIIRYPNDFESFCNSIVNCYQETNDVVSTIYQFLLNNSQQIPQGFPENCDYAFGIKQLSSFIAQKLGMNRPDGNFYKNFKFFNFLRVKLTVISWKGTEFYYKVFGTGNFELFFYVENQNYWCLYHNDPATNPFFNFYPKEITNHVLLCGHSLDDINNQNNRCKKCNKFVYNEEIYMKNNRKPNGGQHVHSGLSNTNQASYPSALKFGQPNQGFPNNLTPQYINQNYPQSNFPGYPNLPNKDPNELPTQNHFPGYPNFINNTQDLPAQGYQTPVNEKNNFKSDFNNPPHKGGENTQNLEKKPEVPSSNPNPPSNSLNNSSLSNQVHGIKTKISNSNYSESFLSTIIQSDLKNCECSQFDNKSIIKICKKCDCITYVKNKEVPSDLQ